jgi:hypothetical protein
MDVNLEELDRVLDHARETPLSEPGYEKSRARCMQPCPARCRPLGSVHRYEKEDRPKVNNAKPKPFGDRLALNANFLPAPPAPYTAACDTLAESWKPNTGSSGIGPPPAKYGVQKQPAEENRR